MGEVDKVFFVTFCIEQYKVYANLDGKDVSEIFFTTGVADYLADNYEVLHTQSRQWLMEEISNYIKTNRAS